MAFQKYEFVDKNIYINDDSEIKLISPFALFVVGCTGSGKSWTVLKWLKYSTRVFQKKYAQVFYFYGSTYQDAFRDPCLKHVKFSSDLKLLEKIVSTKHKSPGILLILDDLMHIAGNSTIIEQLYTRGSHHYNIDIINIVQNIFYKSPNFVTLKENTQYILIKRFINDSKIKLLASQIGVDCDELTSAYIESVSKDRYEGLLVDNHINSNIRKIAKIRDKIASDSPALYITPQNFEYYCRKNVLKKVDDNAFYLDVDMLKDRCTSV